MKIVIAVPYAINTSGTIAFATRLCESLRAISIDAMVAGRQPNDEASSKQKSVATDQTQSDKPHQVEFSTDQELLNFVEQQASDCDAIFWAGVFIDADSRKEQIKQAANIRAQLGTKIVFMWERTGQSNVIPELDLFQLLTVEGSDAIAVLNHSQGDALIKLGVEPEKVKLFSPGIDTQSQFVVATPHQKTSVRTDWGWDDQTTIFLAMARFVERKRIDFIIQTWLDFPESHPSAILLLVGTGFGAVDSNEDKVKRLAAKDSSIELIQFNNGLDHTQFYNASDVFVTASSMEGEPMALQESMASGLPPIVSNIAGHRELIEDNKTGLFFDCDSADELAQCFSKMCNNSLRRRQMGRATRSSIVAKRDISVVVKQFLEIVAIDSIQNHKVVATR